MRSYLLDSPQAAARIVALVLVSDGQLKPVELNALEALRADERLGLEPGGLRQIVHAFCADLLADATRAGDADCRIDAGTIARLLGEVERPRLRRTVLRLCTAVVHADRRVHEGESIVMLAAMDRWGLSPETLAALAEPETTQMPPDDRRAVGVARRVGAAGSTGAATHHPLEMPGGAR